MSHATDVFYDGRFPFAMGQQSHEPSDEELMRLDAMVDAQDALDGALDQAARTQCPPGEADQILGAVLNAWAVLKRARHAVG